MKHPDREQLIPYLFGEASREDRTQLAKHLKECPECAQEIAAWRGSLRKMDRWTLPKAKPGNNILLFPVVKWALAAGLVLGFGFLIGRVSMPTPVNAAELRAQIEESMRASFQEQMERSLQQIQTGTFNAVAEAEARLAKAATGQNKQLWQAFLDVLATARAEDKQAVQVALQQFQEQHSTEYVSLRKDLETLASMTDDEFRQARMKIVQLAANSGPTE
jgi:anti-sigma factor RsiW